MIQSRSHNLLFVAILLSITLPTSAQMPDWQPFRDREGNIFYCDRAGKIFITDNPVYPARTVSSDGVEYYYHLGSECLRSGNYTDGLRILKAVCCLTQSDERIRDFSKKAAGDISGLKRRAGPRFEKYNAEAQPLLYKENGITVLVNESMDYSLRCSDEMDVLRVNRRQDGCRIMFGLTLGITGKRGDGGYDCLLALESERDGTRWRSLDEVIENARFRHGADNLKRKEESRSAGRVVYSIQFVQEEMFRGYECITYSGGSAHILRIITPDGKFQESGRMMEKIIAGFHPVER